MFHKCFFMNLPLYFLATELHHLSVHSRILPITVCILMRNDFQYSHNVTTFITIFMKTIIYISKTTVRIVYICTYVYIWKHKTFTLALFYYSYAIFLQIKMFKVFLSKNFSRWKNNDLTASIQYNSFKMHKCRAVRVLTIYLERFRCEFSVNFTISVNDSVKFLLTIALYDGEMRKWRCSVSCGNITNPLWLSNIVPPQV